jgi:hypothetical protein
MTALDFTTGPRPADDRHALSPCEIYQAWQAAWQDAEDAFQDWCSVGYGRKADAYAVYRAATDREDAAAACWLVV